MENQILRTSGIVAKVDYEGRETIITFEDGRHTKFEMPKQETAEKRLRIPEGALILLVHGAHEVDGGAIRVLEKVGGFLPRIARIGFDARGYLERCLHDEREGHVRRLREIPLPPGYRKLKNYRWGQIGIEELPPEEKS